MKTAKIRKYRTGLESLTRLKPKIGDRCQPIHDRLTHLMSKNDAVKSVILLGDHFLAEYQDRAEETFPLIEALIVSSGEEEDRKDYHDKFHKEYVLSFWNEGIYGNIDTVSEAEIEQNGGINKMLVRGGNALGNILKAD